MHTQTPSSVEAYNVMLCQSALITTFTHALERWRAGLLWFPPPHCSVSALALLEIFFVSFYFWSALFTASVVCVSACPHFILSFFLFIHWFIHCFVVYIVASFLYMVYGSSILCIVTFLSFTSVLWYKLDSTTALCEFEDVYLVLLKISKNAVSKLEP